MEKRPAVLTIEAVDYVQSVAEKVYVDRAIKQYISYIVDVTRHTEKVLPAELSRYVRMGASPRASISRRV